MSPFARVEPISDSQEEKLEAFMRDIMYMLAHGMKNFLSPASTYFQLISDPVSLSPDAMARFGQLAENSIESSLRFCDELYGLSATQAGGHETVRLDAWLREKSSRAGIEVEIRGDCPRLTLDTSLWGAIVDEVFRNVAMHGHAQADVTCEVMEDSLQLIVADHGPGLSSYAPPPRTFAENAEAVVQLTRRRAGSTGTGLGLVRASWAALLLHGQLALEEVDPYGLSVRVAALRIKP